MVLRCRARRKEGTRNARHGSAGFAARIPASAGVKAIKRYGYGSKAEAKAAAERAGRLLDLAGATTPPAPGSET